MSKQVHGMAENFGGFLNKTEEEKQWEKLALPFITIFLFYFQLDATGTFGRCLVANVPLCLSPVLSVKPAGLELCARL